MKKLFLAIIIFLSACSHGDAFKFYNLDSVREATKSESVALSGRIQKSDGDNVILYTSKCHEDKTLASTSTYSDSLTALWKCRATEAYSYYGELAMFTLMLNPELEKVFDSYDDLKTRYAEEMEKEHMSTFEIVLWVGTAVVVGMGIGFISGSVAN